ncbi:MAG: transposase [Eubacterium sp.]
MENGLPKRKPNRLKEFDYSTNGAYFITICVKDRKCVLGKIVGEGLCALPKIELTPIGNEIVNSIKYINKNYENVFIEKYVIMPNHIHLIVILDNQTGGRGNPPLQNVIGQLKSYTTKKYGKQLWQRSYYDHIIRNEDDYLNIWEYVNSNALKWAEDEFYTGDENIG